MKTHFKVFRRGVGVGEIVPLYERIFKQWNMNDNDTIYEFISQ